MMMVLRSDGLLATGLRDGVVYGMVLVRMVKSVQDTYIYMFDNSPTGCGLAVAVVLRSLR